MKLIAHSGPWITDADTAAVERVLRSRMLAQGGVARELEQRLAGWVGMRDGVAVGSGSAALTLAVMALGPCAGKEVIVPTYVCRSVREAVLSAGAQPVLCDSGPRWVIEAAAVKRLITPQTLCVIVPHLYGVFADVAAIRALGVPVIEDCAQALAAEGERRSVADIAMFSLHPTKCVTGGEGGCAVASDPALVERMRRLRDGAADGSAARLISPLSDIAAALALSQLSRYGEFLERRRAIAARYDAALPGAKRPASGMHFRYVVSVAGGLEKVAAQFAEHGVAVRKGVDELMHRLAGLPDAQFPVAVRHFETSVSLPLYPALTEEEIKTCVGAAQAVVGAATPSRQEAHIR
jgi:dTDP-4-amino-4,6-dideoxygalactose transaminase